jgi:hypothetical protein
MAAADGLPPSPRLLRAGGVTCWRLEHDPAQTFVAPKPTDTDCYVRHGGTEGEVFITLYQSPRQTAATFRTSSQASVRTTPTTAAC